MLWVMPLCKCSTPLSKDVGTKSSATGCNSYQNAYSTCSDQLLITIFSALDSDREELEEITPRTLVPRVFPAIFKIIDEKTMGMRLLLPNLVFKALPNYKGKALGTRLPTCVFVDGQDTSFTVLVQQLSLPNASSKNGSWENCRVKLKKQKKKQLGSKLQ